MSAEQCEAGATIQQASYDDHSYRIQAGDQLAIDFYLNTEFNDNLIVSPDGKINMRVVGAMRAAGLTSQQLAEEIDKAYQNELRNPGASVHVQNMPSRQVYVEGEVTKPGSFPLQPGMTVLQAVADAGGLTPDASDTAILIRRDACGRAEGSKLNLAKAFKDPSTGEDAMLMPHDVIAVPRSTIADMDLWVKHYVRDMLPIQPYAAIPF